MKTLPATGAAISTWQETDPEVVFEAYADGLYFFTLVYVGPGAASGQLGLNGDPGGQANFDGWNNYEGPPTYTPPIQGKTLYLNQGDQLLWRGTAGFKLAGARLGEELVDE